MSYKSKKISGLDKKLYCPIVITTKESIKSKNLNKDINDILNKKLKLKNTIGKKLF